MFDPSQFTVSKAKPLPICLLLDVSGSMSGEKIDNLNYAVSEMLRTFAEEEKMETEILVSVITFGNEVKLHMPPTKASLVEWKKITADGNTPMGTAFKMAKALIEDKEMTPSRAWRPTIVLVSDGGPTDSWQSPLEDFINNGRSAKCDRMAMAIGSGADEKMLQRFIAGTPNQLFYAENATKLHEFFQFVTMSVTYRTKSKNPNEVPNLSQIVLDGNSLSSQANTPSAPVGRPADDEGYW